VTLAIVNPAGKPESVPALLGFGFLTVVFAYHWLWNLSGREELEFTPLRLTSRRILFGISRSRTFEMDRIADLHFVGSRSRGMSGRTPSGLGFYYDGRAVRLCDHVTEAEATALGLGLLVIHMIGFIAVLQRSTEWHLTWFMAVVLVEVPCFAVALGMVVDRKPSH
jgi:hypothetical protein